jgi:hypothetical protein
MFSDEDFFKGLNMLLDRQLRDLELVLGVGADLLCLVGCCNTIEFIGGIWNGKLGSNKVGDPRRRFNDGVKLLGGKWSSEVTVGQRRVSEVTIQGRTFKGDFIVEEQKRLGVTITTTTAWGSQKFGEEALWALRNALTHQYVARSEDETRSFPMIAIEGSIVTWIIDSKALQSAAGRSIHLLPINIKELIKDIKKACQKLISELESNDEKRGKANECLFKLPRIKNEFPT